MQGHIESLNVSVAISLPFKPVTAKKRQNALWHDLMFRR